MGAPPKEEKQNPPKKNQKNAGNRTYLCEGQGSLQEGWEEQNGSETRRDRHRPVVYCLILPPCLQCDLPGLVKAQTGLPFPPAYPAASERASELSPFPYPPSTMKAQGKNLENVQGLPQGKNLHLVRV